MDIALLKAIVTALTTLITMVGGLQAEVNTLKGQAANGVTLGAVSALNSPLEVAGTQTYYARQSFNGLVGATSNLKAAFKSPNATSTFSGGCNVSANSAANVLHLGWGATSGATTSLLAAATLAANVPGIAFATSSNLTLSVLGGKDGAVPPNSFVSFRMYTRNATGTCTAIFTVL